MTELPGSRRRLLVAALAAAAFTVLSAAGDRSLAEAFQFDGLYKVRGRAVAKLTVPHRGRPDSRYRAVGARSTDTLTISADGTYAFADGGSDDPFGSGTWTEQVGGALPHIALAPDDAGGAAFAAELLSSLRRGHVVPRAAVSAVITSSSAGVEFTAAANGRDRLEGVESVSVSLRDADGSELAYVSARAHFRGRRKVEQ